MIHPTAIVGFQPMQSAAIARPVQSWPMPLYGERFQAGPFALVYTGTRFGNGCILAPRASVRRRRRTPS